MAYKLIQPPFTLRFREMSRAELTSYYQWFLAAIPDRINELTHAVRLASGFEKWQPDRTPASLDALGDWLSVRVETRQRTAEELREIKSRSTYPIDVPASELTNETFSVAMDIGMYLSQVFLHSFPTLRWYQEFKSKKSVDYGQPVLVGFGSTPFNPTQVMVTLAYGLAAKTKTGSRLRQIYDYWTDRVQ